MTSKKPGQVTARSVPDILAFLEQKQDEYAALPPEGKAEFDRKQAETIEAFRKGGFEELAAKLEGVRMDPRHDHLNAELDTDS